MTICTDGAASMTDKHSEVVACVTELVPNIIQTHCIITSRSSCCKTLQTINVGSLVFMCQSCKFNQNLPTSVSIVFTTWQRTNVSDHSNLLLHTKVQWLFHEKIVERPFQTAKKGITALKAHNTDFASLISDEFWLGKLAYLADIFNLLNALNLSLQRRVTNVSTTQNKIIAITKKLQIRKNRIETMY